jgi:hypothetical protein
MYAFLVCNYRQKDCILHFRRNGSLFFLFYSISFHFAYCKVCVYILAKILYIYLHDYCNMTRHCKLYLPSYLTHTHTGTHTHTLSTSSTYAYTILSNCLVLCFFRICWLVLQTTSGFIFHNTFLNA